MSSVNVLKLVSINLTRKICRKEKVQDSTDFKKKPNRYKQMLLVFVSGQNDEDVVNINHSFLEH